jgi:hypothetical protein
MSEEQDIPKQPPKVEATSDPNMQDSLISSSETQPPNMEVHHHPDLHHKRKHFREYVLEFFMIFLAVTMGFFAENIREGITENAKAKEFAQSLYGDLKKDTSFLNLILGYKLWRGLKTDSLISLLDSENIQKNAKRLYYYNSAMDGNIAYHSSDATIQQLRNSGGLRYFKNAQLTAAIARYYDDINFYVEMEHARYVRVPFNLSSNIFQSTVMMSTLSLTPDPRDAIHMPDGNPQILTTDKHILNEYLLYAVNLKYSNELSILLLHQMVEKNLNELMGDLQKEYNLH